MKKKASISEDLLKKLDKPTDEIKGLSQEKNIREMNIVIDKKQCTVRIPAKFAEKINIKKTDKFVFKLIPIDDTGEYTIVAELKRV